MDPYIGIVVFELEASPMAAQPSFFREDFYIVYADTQEEAYARVEPSATLSTWHRLYTTTFMKTVTYIPDILRHLPTTSGLK